MKGATETRESRRSAAEGPKRPTYPASTRKGCLQLVMVLNLLWATGEAAFLIFAVWLGHNFRFRSTGITFAALQSGELAVLLSAHGLALHKLTFTARYHCAFAAVLVLFPLAHVLNFLALLALVSMRRNDDDAVKRLLFGKKLQNHDVLGGMLTNLQGRVSGAQ